MICFKKSTDAVRKGLKDCKCSMLGTQSCVFCKRVENFCPAPLRVPHSPSDKLYQTNEIGRRRAESPSSEDWRELLGGGLQRVIGAFLQRDRPLLGPSWTAPRISIWPEEVSVHQHQSHTLVLATADDTVAVLHFFT